MTSGIYGIKHKTTGKWYVGASKNIEHRIKVHIHDLLTWPDEKEFSRDVAKYGLNIEWSILEVCDKSLFGEKEKQWVSAFRSDEKGYNRQKGGGNHRNWK